MSAAHPITVWITRTVKPGREAAFEQALHDFAARSLPLPGQLGSHIVRPAPGGGSRTYRVLRKFADRGDLATFRASPEYAEFNRIASELTEGEPRIEELNGLESWCTPEGAELRPLPRWKMAVVTFCGVYPLTSYIPRMVGRLLPGWHPLLLNLVVTGLVVASLTWVVMPFLTRLLHGWLHAEPKPQPSSVPS